MLKHCVCCVALCITQLGGIPVPTTIKRGKSSRRKKRVLIRYSDFSWNSHVDFHVLRMYGGIARVTDCPVGGVARGGD